MRIADLIRGDSEKSTAYLLKIDILSM